MIAIINLKVKEVFEQYNDFAKEMQNLAIFTRDINLQRNGSKRIITYIKTLDKLILSNDLTETEKNLLLFMRFCIEAVNCELRMVISLKRNNMDAAWGALVQAQSNIGIAASNHPFDSAQLDGYINHLSYFETLLFPRMMYASVGGIIKKTRCNICNLGYEDCDHMKGKFYDGQLCVREIHEMELEEVSVVTNPASKLNRQLETEYKGKSVNVLTLKPSVKAKNSS